MSLSINSLLKETATSVGDISLCSQTIDVVKIPFASFISSSVEVHRNRAKEKQNEKVGLNFHGRCRQCRYYLSYLTFYVDVYEQF